MPTITIPRPFLCKRPQAAACGGIFDSSCGIAGRPVHFAVVFSAVNSVLNEQTQSEELQDGQAILLLEPSTGYPAGLPSAVSQPTSYRTAGSVRSGHDSVRVTRPVFAGLL